MRSNALSRFRPRSRLRTRVSRPSAGWNCRIGVNLGDVMVDGEQIYGDGLNVAARLESLADPGGICISDTVHARIRNKLALNYEACGAGVHRRRDCIRPASLVAPAGPLRVHSFCADSRKAANLAQKQDTYSRTALLLEPVPALMYHPAGQIYETLSVG